MHFQRPTNTSRCPLCSLAMYEGRGWHKRCHCWALPAGPASVTRPHCAHHSALPQWSMWCPASWAWPRAGEPGGAAGFDGQTRHRLAGRSGGTLGSSGDGGTGPHSSTGVARSRGPGTAAARKRRGSSLIGWVSPAVGWTTEANLRTLGRIHRKRVPGGSSTGGIGGSVLGLLRPPPPGGLSSSSPRSCGRSGG